MGLAANYRSIERVTARSIVSLAFSLAPVEVSAAGGFVGYWFTEDHRSAVEIDRVGDLYFGRIVWMKQAVDEAGRPWLDVENPDPARRSDPLQGIVLLSNFTLSERGWLEGGRIYDPGSGNSYRCQMKLVDGGLEVRGFIGFSFFGRSQVWTRCASLDRLGRGGAELPGAADFRRCAEPVSPGLGENSDNSATDGRGDSRR